jgi:Ca2+-binding RTX toxin-like protein
LSNDLLNGDRLNNTILGLAGNDTLRGGQGDDQLIGGGGNDLIVGGAGGDRLIGGNGLDTLRGGTGEDQFIFQNVQNKADRILDFDVTEDVILIRKSGFDLDLGKGRLANARFTIGSGAGDRGDRFIYNDQTGALIFDADGSGAGEGRAIAFLSNSPDLTAADIRII